MPAPAIIYSDGLLDISYFNGMVHFSVGHLLPAREGQEGAQGVPVERFVMSPAALLRSMRQMEQLVEQLADRGVFKRQEPEAAVSATPESAYTEDA